MPSCFRLMPGEELEVVIPEKIDRLPVYAIAGLAFYESVPVESVTIPEGVTTIGDSAFSGCTKLSAVYMPATVSSIGDNAFYGVTALAAMGKDVTVVTDRKEFGSSVEVIHMYVMRKRFAQGDAEALESKPYKYPVKVLENSNR